MSECSFLAPVGLIQSASLLGRWCSGLSLMELSTPPVLLISLPVSPQPSSPAAFPDTLGRQSPGRVAFTTFLVPFGRPTTPRTPLPISLTLIGSLPSVPPEDPESPPGVTAQIFRTVPSANTLVRWVNENAFAPIVRARPCPTFGRPVRLRGGPHRLRPGTSPHALRIPPRGGHPALRVTRAGSRSPLAVSGFRLRARLGFSIPSSPRPARNYPRFRIRRPSSGRRRDLNPPDHHAAQRTLRSAPTSRRWSGRASVFLHLAVPLRAPVFAPMDPTPARGLELWVWQPHARNCGKATTGPLRFLGNPPVHMPCSSTPAGPTRQDIRRSRRDPRIGNDEGSREFTVFRGSIARPVHSLSTLRPGDCSTRTPDSLLAAVRSTGRDWLPAGFQRKVSELLLTSLPPFPSFPDAMPTVRSTPAPVRNPR